MRTPSRRRAALPYHPLLLPLEERLPLGDGILGMLTSLALLPAPAAPTLGSEPGTSTVGRISNPSGWTDGLEIRPTASRAAAWEGEAAPALHVPTWEALTDLFAPAARRRHDTFSPSPQRQQGPDASPLLALRAGESAAPTVVAYIPSTPARVTRPEGTPLALVAGGQAPAPAATRNVTPTQETQVRESFGKLPLYFEENVGQTDAAVQFFTRGPGYALYLTGTEAVMVLSQPAGRTGDVSPLVQDAVPDWMPHQGADAPRSPDPPAVVRLQLVGANAMPAVTGRDQLPGKINYFLGNDPAKWHTNIATFAEVKYNEVYPGIDLVWYGRNRQLEYDFVVSPSADPNAIRLNVSGAERLELDANGDLLVHVGEPGRVSAGSTLRQHKPFVYQEVNGTRREVASRFVLEGQEVRFAVGAYDAGRPLVIDPVLSYSTYLGGSDWDVGRALTLDPATGGVLLTGYTLSPDFPTAEPLQAINRGGYDVFVARLSAAGGSLVYSTYLGGGNWDYGIAVAADPATGDTLVIGQTLSADFPTARPLQGSNRGGYDVFAARLSASGSDLVYSTYLGGGNDHGRGVALDPATGDTLLVGYTQSSNFPTARPLQAAHAGDFDAFVARLSADGGALVFSTYLGGDDDDRGYALAVDSATGDALATGFTESTDFPTTPGALDLTCGTDGNCDFDGKDSYYDAFLTRIGSAPAASYFVYPDGGQSQAGVPFDLYVYALDANGFVLPDYTGEVAFFSTDKQATLPKPYTFQRADRGVAYFAAGVTLVTPGMQELYVFDTATYTVFGVAVFEVV